MFEKLTANKPAARKSRPTRAETPPEERENPLDKGEWEELSDKYDFKATSEVYRIFPKNPKTGKSMVIWIRRAFLQLRHRETGENTIYKFYKHQRSYYWRRLGDERSSKRDHERKRNVPTMREIPSQPRWEIQDQVSRMAFGGDKAAADRLLTMVEAQIKI